MKRKKTHRLELSRETLRALASDVMNDARGGYDLTVVPKTYTKKAGTCTSCDGPDSCRDVCINTEPL